MKSLDQIFNEMITDKGSHWGDKHNYAAVYSALFAPLRTANIKLLEIGIYDGASLKSWHEYFTNAIIHSAEIDPRHDSKFFENMPRIKIYHGDATDPALIAETGFTVIIDDANHALETQVRLIEALWDKLESGGFYIIEDLFVGELPWGGMASDLREDTGFEYQGHASGGETTYLPKHPQDLSFLNRKYLPEHICKILDNNEHFFTISAIGKAGGLHMMLVINKS